MQLCALTCITDIAVEFVPSRELQLNTSNSLDHDLRTRAQIVASQPLKAGTEVFNCYGELSNTELLLKYGFALRGNPFSSVELDKAGLVAAAIETLGAKAAGARRRFLKEHR